MYLRNVREAEFYVGVVNGKYDNDRAAKDLKIRYSEQVALAACGNGQH